MLTKFLRKFPPPTLQLAMPLSGSVKSQPRIFPSLCHANKCQVRTLFPISVVFCFAFILLCMQHVGGIKP